MIVGIYARVSTQEQARDGYSIDEQVSRLTSYCNGMGWTIYDAYIDAGRTGSNTNRPELQRMLTAVREKKIEKVVVYKLDRLSRSQKDTLSLIEDCFLANGADFVSMTENFDTSTPLGRAMIGILSVFAQLEREQIKERFLMGREGRAKEGKYHGGGYDPVGYDYVDGQLVVNEFEALQIREAHDLFQQGKGFRTIAKIFTQKGYRQKHGKWTHKRVQLTLLNDLYIGNVRFGGEVYKGTHEPIIDADTYNRTMTLYKSNDNTKYKNNGRASYLAGLLYCARCGARYGHFKYDSRGNTYEYYSCYSRRKQSPSMVKDPTCQNKHWRMEELDDIVFGEIRKLAIDPDYTQRSDPKDDAEKKKAILQKEIERIDSQKSKYMDLYTIDGISLDEIQKKISPLNDQREKLSKELDALSEKGMQKEEAITMINSFDDALREGSFDEVVMLIHALIDRIEIDGEDITIYWNF